jgi:hypothetical protein
MEEGEGNVENGSWILEEGKMEHGKRSIENGTRRKENENPFSTLQAKK